MSLRNFLKLPNEPVIDPGYFVMLESHLPYLREKGLTSTKVVEGQQAAKYAGDFHGLLNSLQVGKKFHYLVTRLNGYVRSQDYDGLRTEILLVDERTVSGIIATYTSNEA